MSNIFIRSRDIQNKCTKHQFMHLLTAACNEWHIENSKNHKKVISLNITSSNCQCTFIFAVLLQ